MSLSPNALSVSPDPTIYGGVFPGKVYSTADPQGSGRIQMYIPQIFGIQPVRIWAPCTIPGSTVPNVGDLVWCIFQGGDPAYPTYLPTAEAGATGASEPYYRGWVPGGGYCYSAYLPNDQLFVAQFSHVGDLIAQPMYVSNPMPSGVAMQQIGFYGKSYPSPQSTYEAGLYANLGTPQGAPYYVGPNYPGALVHDFGDITTIVGAGLGRCMSTGTAYRITTPGLYWLVLMGKSNLTYGSPMYVTTYGGTSPWNDPMQEYGQPLLMGNTPVTGDPLPSAIAWTGISVPGNTYAATTFLPTTFPLVSAGWQLLPATDCPWILSFT